MSSKKISSDPITTEVVRGLLDTAAEEVQADEESSEEAPADETPVEEAPAEETPAPAPTWGDDEDPWADN